MPKFMTSLPKLESQKQRKRTEEQRKGSAKAFFRWSCGDAITLIEFWQLPHKSLTNCPFLIPFSLRITGRKWDVVVLPESMSKKGQIIVIMDRKCQDKKTTQHIKLVHMPWLHYGYIHDWNMNLYFFVIYIFHLAEGWHFMMQIPVIFSVCFPKKCLLHAGITLVENNQKMSHFSKTRQIGHFLAFSMNFCLNCKRSSLRSQCCKMRLFLRFFKHRVKTEIFRKFCSRTIVYSLLVPPLLLWLDHLSRQMARFWIFPPFDKATAHSRSFIIPITFNHGIRTSIVWFNWVFPILLPNYLSLIMI